LKGIEVQMVKHVVQGVGRVVSVHQLLLAFELMFAYIKINVHFVLGMLLPVAVLR
jgi:hypothetical protein